MCHIPTVPQPSTSSTKRRNLLRGALGSIAIGLLPSMSFALSSHSAIAPTLRRIKFAPNRATASATDRAQWAAFRDRFITNEGRVIDTANGGVSHSEGQGYSMLLAEWANDRSSFERVFDWTRSHLSRPSDSLHGWCWDPHAPLKMRDMNTATDGELAIAWALLRAAERWNVPEWRARALMMSRDILATSVQEANGRLFLLPGAFGFNKPDRLNLNPSYYNFPAIRALANASDDPRWINIDDNGLWLLEEARFGKRGLSPDWVDVMKETAEVLPPSNGKLVFSWDAIRVPLFLAWAGENAAPALNAAAAFWTSKDGRWIPAWVNLRNGSLAPYEGHAGIVAVARLTLASVALQSGAGVAVADIPSQAEVPDYYAGALALLSRLAWQESRATPHHPKPQMMS